VIGADVKNLYFSQLTILFNRKNFSEFCKVNLVGGEGDGK
jgi:hypothetical protein